MDELELYEQILDLSSPWSVELVQLDKDTKNLDVFVSCDADTQLFCPKCCMPCSGQPKQDTFT
jgi:hypothetical protein